MPMETMNLATAIRKDALIQIHGAGSGHPGGSLSCADILAVLYGGILNTQGEDRDRFVMSKGHACPALYAAWAQVGLLEPSELAGFRKVGRALQGHPHVLATPLAETSTGSLGQGFSAAVGMALGYRHQQHSIMLPIEQPVNNGFLGTPQQPPGVPLSPPTKGRIVIYPMIDLRLQSPPDGVER